MVRETICGNVIALIKYGIRIFGAKESYVYLMIRELYILFFTACQQITNNFD